LFSLLGLFLFPTDFLIERELALLDGHQDVGVLAGWRNKLSHDVLGVAACAHAQRLETLKGSCIVDVELLEGEAGVLYEVGEERRILHRLDNTSFLLVREVLDRDAYAHHSKVSDWKLHLFHSNLSRTAKVRSFQTWSVPLSRKDDLSDTYRRS